MKFIFQFILFTLLITNNYCNIFKNTDPELNADKGTLEGIVTNEEGEPLIGANVVLQNTTIGSATDYNGKYLIANVPVGKYNLIVSMVGHSSRSVEIEVFKDKVNRNNFSLKMAFYETGSVVVTGTVNPYLYEESPVKTEVVPLKVLEMTKSVNLADALGLQTGVRVENDCQNCNFTQVRILGFEGKYSQILIDGDPVVSSLAGVYALEQFPKEMIGQIEIIKGGGSAIYGGGAIAGTVNLRTLRPQINRARLNYLGTSINGNMDQNISGVAEWVDNSGSTGAYIFGTFRGRKEYDRNNDGFSELGRLSSNSLGINWFYKFTDTNVLTASVHRIYEDRRGGNDFSLPEHEADIAESTKHNRWGGKIKWEHTISSDFNYCIYTSISLLKRDSYYGGLTDLNNDGYITELDVEIAKEFYGHSKNNTYVTGARGNYILENHIITAGMEYSNDNLVDNSVKELIYRIDNTYTNFGFYLQDDLSFGHSLNIILGTRIDKHSELEKVVVSPRISLKYEISEGLDLRASYSTGFKAPQIFDEDLHIESLGGNQRVVRNIPGLKHESSQTFSGGIEFQQFVANTPVLIGITCFYTQLKDAFAEVESNESSTDLVLWNRINTDGATLYGLDLDFGIRPLKEVEIRSGLTWKHNEYDAEQEVLEGKFTKKFQRTPDVFGHLRIIYEPDENLNFIASTKFTGTTELPNESTGEIVQTASSFLELDLGMSYQPELFKTLGVQLSAGVKNLFDSYQEDLGVGAERDPAYLYGPQMPRRYYVGLELSF